MKTKTVVNIARDLKKMLPTEILVKTSKLSQEKFFVFAKFEENEFFLVFEGFGDVRIAKNRDGYVSYCGRLAHNPKKDVLDIVKAMFGKSKTYKGVWHWRGETFTQSVPL